MSWSDPIADMLTRIRNAQCAGLEDVSMPSSRLKAEVARIFKSEGYILDFKVEGDVKKSLVIELKYSDQDSEPAIRGLRRESKPGLRRFCGWKDIPRVLGGLGTSVLSTSQGVMSGREARRRKIGGELLCSIW